MPIPTAPPSVLLQPRGVGPERGAEVAGLWPRRPAGEGGGARVPLSSPLRMPAGSLVRSPCSRAEKPARGARAVKAALGGGASVAEPRGGRGLRRSARAGRGFPLGKDPGGKRRGPRCAASVRLLKIFHWGRGRQSGLSARAVAAQMFSAQPASAQPATT